MDDRPEDEVLRSAVTDELLQIVDSAIAGYLRDVPPGDVRGAAEAVASRVIAMVRGVDASNVIGTEPADLSGGSTAMTAAWTSQERP